MITDYLESLLGEGTPHNTRKGLQYSYECPLCNDHKERLFINVDRGKFFCHHCDAGGTIVTFIALFSNITWKQSLDIYREYQGYEIALPESIEDEIHSMLIELPQIEIPKYVHPLPDEMIFMDDARGKAGNEAWQYLKSRGVSMDTCLSQGIGYCAEGKYANRIIMPDFEDGELVYWQARTWEPEPKNKLLKKYFRKVLNPSLDEEQIDQGIVAIDKSEVVSNMDYIKELGMAVVCEGRFDSYTIGDFGACIHGKHLSDDQFLKLVLNKDKIDTVAVMLDGDAFSYSMSTADRLSRYMDNVLVCRLTGKDDPSKIGKKGVLEALNNAVQYDSMFRVKAQLKGWI